MSKLEVDAIEPQSGTTLTIGASGDTVNIASGATITDFTSTGIDDNATSTAITIDSSERVGIGETSMDGLLVIKGDSNSSSMPSIRLKDGADAREAFVTNESGDLILATTNSSDDVIDSAIKIYTSQMIFSVNNNTERMRIDSSGNVLIAKTALSVTTRGIQLEAQGVCAATNDGGLAYIANRLTNDGTLFSFRQASTEEGSISVSGATVSYNGFTGTHWSRFTDDS